MLALEIRVMWNERGHVFFMRGFREFLRQGGGVEVDVLWKKVLRGLLWKWSLSWTRGPNTLGKPELSDVWQKPAASQSCNHPKRCSRQIAKLQGWSSKPFGFGVSRILIQYFSIRFSFSHLELWCIFCSNTCWTYLIWLFFYFYGDYS